MKEENILFPYMEKKHENHGLSIMWTLHDHARDSINKVIHVLEDDNFSLKKFNVEIGKLFFAMLGIVNKENLILFPTAMEVINYSEWEDMNKQSIQYEFPFIEIPKINEQEKVQIHGFKDMIFSTDTGELTLFSIDYWS